MSEVKAKEEDLPPKHRFNLVAEILPKNEKTEEILKLRDAQEAARLEKVAAQEAALQRQRAEAKKKASKAYDT